MKIGEEEFRMMNNHSSGLMEELGSLTAEQYADWLQRSFDRLSEEVSDDKLAAIIIAYSMAAHMLISYLATCEALDMPDYVREAIFRTAVRHSKEMSDEGGSDRG